MQAATLTPNREPQPVLFMPVTILKYAHFDTYIVQNAWGLCEVSWLPSFGYQVNTYPKGATESMYGIRVGHIYHNRHHYTPVSERQLTGQKAIDLYLKTAIHLLDNLLTLSK